MIRWDCTDLRIIVVTGWQGRYGAHAGRVL
jgi:hypothetical protein